MIRNSEPTYGPTSDHTVLQYMVRGCDRQRQVRRLSANPQAPVNMPIFVSYGRLWADTAIRARRWIPGSCEGARPGTTTPGSSRPSRFFVPRADISGG